MTSLNHILNPSEGPHEQQHQGNEGWTGGLMSIESLVVAKIHEEFEALPKKCKPGRYGFSNEFTEWTVVSGIAVVGPSGSIEHVSLASGMKCIPRTIVANAKGCVLHDSHAEILAIRAFNRFLLDEVDQMLNGPYGNGDDVPKSVKYQSKIVQWRDDSSKSSSDDPDHWQPPFKIKDDLRIFMYCSEMPCGDASIELVLSRQKDQTPWPVDESQAKDKVLKGMSHLSQLGIVRRKPGRADSRDTGSKSCSDKLALKQCTSLLSSLTSAFITPCHAYIDTLILPEVQYSRDACTRSFGPTGRMKPVSDKQWVNGYHFHPFSVSTTNVPFAYARHWYDSGFADDRAFIETDRIRNSNCSAIKTPSRAQVTINGVLQGRRQYDPRGASMVSRVSMMNLAIRIRDSLHRNAVCVLDQGTTAALPQPKDMTVTKPRSLEALAVAVDLVMTQNEPTASGSANDKAQCDQGARAIGLFKGASTYYEARRDLALKAKEQVKKYVVAVALKNWIPNERDDFPITQSR